MVFSSIIYVCIYFWFSCMVSVSSFSSYSASEVHHFLVLQFNTAYSWLSVLMLCSPSLLLLKLKLLLVFLQVHSVSLSESLFPMDRVMVTYCLILIKLSWLEVRTLKSKRESNVPGFLTSSQDSLIRIRQYGHLINIFV